MAFTEPLGGVCAGAAERSAAMEVLGVPAQPAGALGVEEDLWPGEAK